MAYVQYVVAASARDRRQSTPSDAIQVASIEIGGTDVNGSNLVTTTNSAVLTNKTLNGSLNTIVEIYGSSLTNDAKQKVLEYRKMAAWDQINAFTASSSSNNVTEAIENTASTDLATTSANDKGILTTGTGSGGAGIENYVVQIRNNTTGDPIEDGEVGQVYAQLVHGNATIATGSISTNTGSDQVTGSATTFQSDFQVGDALYDATEALIGYIASIESDTAMTLSANALVGVTSQANYIRHRYSLYYKQRDGGTYTFAAPTAIDFLFAEVFDYNDRPWRADLYGTGFVDPITIPMGHTHDASDITSGTLSTDRFSAYDDLVAESKIGSGSTQVAAGDHTHAFSQISGTIDPSQFSAYSDLIAESKIGTGSDQVASGNHVHAFSQITGTVDPSQFSAYADLVVESKIGTGSDQVAAGNHVHDFSQLTGTAAYSQFDAYGDLVNDSKIGTGSDQVAAGNHAHAFSQITGTLDPSQFSAYSDLVAESKIGTASDQVAAGNHAHAFSQITGTLDPSQFSAYSDLVAESKIGTASDQVAAGDHAHAFSQITGTLDPSQFSAYSDLVAESKIGTASDQVAAGNHAHAFSQITGTLDPSQFSAYSDLVAESKIGTASDQVAAGDHAHAFSQITGTVSTDQFSAYADLVAESKIGTASDQVAAGDHVHDFSEITGSVSTSQFDAYADLVADSRIGTGASQVAAGDHTHATLLPRTYTTGESIAVGKVCYVATDGKTYLADKDVSNVHIKRIVVAASSIQGGASGPFYYNPGTTIPDMGGLSSIVVGQEVYLFDDGTITQDISAITTGVRMVVGYGLDASQWELMQQQYIEHAV